MENPSHGSADCHGLGAPGAVEAVSRPRSPAISGVRFLERPKGAHKHGVIGEAIGGHRIGGAFLLARFGKEMSPWVPGRWVPVQRPQRPKKRAIIHNLSCRSVKKILDQQNVNSGQLQLQTTNCITLLPSNLSPTNSLT